MGEEESMQFGDYEVCNLSESSESSYIVRELLLTHIAVSFFVNGLTFLNSYSATAKCRYFSFLIIV